MNNEEWRPIPDYADMYEVSSFGEIRNLKTKKLLKCFKNHKGYYTVSLYSGRSKGKSRQKSYLVHRLVALAFIPNPEGLPEVDHIDGCCTNNQVSNLRWCTRLDNVLNPNTLCKYYRKVQSQEHRENCSKAKDACKKAVICVETEERWDSSYAAATALGLAQSTVHQSCMYAKSPTYRKLSKMNGQPVKHFMFLEDWLRLHKEN